VVRLRPGPESHGRRSAVPPGRAPGGFHAVLQEVDENLEQGVGVTGDGREGRGDVDGQRDAPGVDLVLERATGLEGERHRVDRDPLARPAAGEVEETSDETRGAKRLALDLFQDAPAGVDDSFTVLHLVPGIEYRLSDTVDLVAEFGIAVNDNASNYVGAGISYYIR